MNFKRQVIVFGMSLIITFILLLSLFLPTQPHYARKIQVRHNLEMDVDITNFYKNNFSKQTLMIPIGSPYPSNQIEVYLNGEIIEPNY